MLVTYYRDRWEKHRYPFSNEQSRSYRAFEDEVVGAMEAMAADASEETGRDMTVGLEKTNHHHDRAEGYTLQFEFVWTNSAESRAGTRYCWTSTIREITIRILLWGFLRGSSTRSRTRCR